MVSRREPSIYSSQAIDNREHDQATSRRKTEAFLTASNGNTVQVTDHNALQVTPPPEGKGAFGEAIVTNLRHEVQGIFVYGVDGRYETRVNHNGTAAGLNGMAHIATGATSSVSAEIRSKDVVRYQPGHGSRLRFTHVFTTGVAGNTQIAGLGDESNGMFFGYNGTAFGILHRHGGSPEIRTLTIASGSTTAEDITLTLDGTNAASVTVTNSADRTVTANEIATHDFSAVGTGWKAAAVGPTVVFTSWDGAPHTGTYTIASATSVSGSFAQSIAGITPTDDWVPQASWNGVDKFDGNGLTGVTLDPTKGNVFQVSLQYLGFGGMQFFIEDPDDQEYHLVHTIAYANTSTTPNISNPSLPWSIKTANTTNTTSIAGDAGSIGGFTDGIVELMGVRRGVDNSRVIGANSNEHVIMSIRTNEVFNSKANKAPIKVNYIGAAVDHTKTASIEFYGNAKLTGAVWTPAAAGSVVQVDTTATAFSGGQKLFSLPLGQKGSAIIDLAGTDKVFDALLAPGNTFTATLKPSSGNSAEGSVSFNFVELT